MGEKNFFVNFTNHNSDFWEEKQRKAAEVFGEIVDIPFPNVNPNDTELKIEELGKEYFYKIMAYSPNAVLCQGEFTLAFNVVQRLKEHNIKVVAACSKRMVVEKDGIKTSIFEFTKFRDYV